MCTSVIARRLHGVLQDVHADATVEHQAHTPRIEDGELLDVPDALHLLLPHHQSFRYAYARPSMSCHMLPWAFTPVVPGGFILVVFQHCSAMRRPSYPPVGRLTFETDRSVGCHASFPPSHLRSCGQRSERSAMKEQRLLLQPCRCAKTDRCYPTSASDYSPCST